MSARRTTTLALATLLLSSCGPSAECKASTEALRSKVAALDWSTAALTETFPYPQVPAAPGRPAPALVTGATTLALDLAHVEFAEHVKPADQPLEPWLARELKRGWSILHEAMDPNSPIYVLATERTPLATIARARKALQDIAVLRFGVRPLGPVPVPWQPSPARRDAFDSALHERVGESADAAYERSMAFAVATTEGCSEARTLVARSGPSTQQRMEQLGTAFAQCNCRGDMDSLAAVYHHFARKGLFPIRWYAWDDALLERLGQNANYGELVRALARQTH